MASDQQRVAPTIAKRIRRMLLRMLVLIGVAYLAIIVFMMVMENKMIYMPTMFPEGNWDAVAQDDRVEEVTIESGDGTLIHGLYAKHANPAGVLLFFHGNAGNVSDRLSRVRGMHDGLQLSVLAIDYRGYGKSEGKVSEKGIILDAIASTEWLADREKVAPETMIFLGRSLGGGVAVDMAARYGARGLILESTFTSLPDVAAGHYPWLPARLIMRNRMNSLEKIARYKGPVLQVHGGADQIIPIEIGRRLHEAIPGRKKFVRFPYGTHNGGLPGRYGKLLQEFFAELEAEKR